MGDSGVLARYLGDATSDCSRFYGRDVIMACCPSLPASFVVASLIDKFRSKGLPVSFISFETTSSGSVFAVGSQDPSLSPHIARKLLLFLSGSGVSLSLYPCLLPSDELFSSLNAEQPPAAARKGAPAVIHSSGRGVSEKIRFWCDILDSDDWQVPLHEFRVAPNEIEAALGLFEEGLRKPSSPLPPDLAMTNPVDMVGLPPITPIVLATVTKAASTL
jgi:hypothetical protein